MQRALIASLALTCLGCGATSQSEHIEEAGEQELASPKPQQEQPKARRDNQRQNQTSPSGKYVLSVPTSFQIKRLEPVHRVTIKSSDGTLLYEDKESRLFAGLNVYFGWDEEDRVWLYNSDDGSIWCWEFDGEGWQRSRNPETAVVPEWILPDYARPEK